ncbi:MAG: trypsin-like peptidase domain-containing protein [Deltaproteobacteria bacterium]|nr:trypsin-like peptidase domain-containing protein [Deltaproteobacteria bacterium]
MRRTKTFSALPSVLLLTTLLAAAPISGAGRAEAADRRTPVVLAVERAVPSVVSIDVELSVQLPFGFLLGGSGTAQTTSQGSGVILRADGVVLTNAHVVDGATTIKVHTADGRVFTAQVVGLDADLDLAVLLLDGAKDLTPIALGKSGELYLGESVIAIGNPYGLGQTVSTGVVSSRAREVELAPGVYQHYIQTDAAINPGNSGGALVNLDGQLIGLNTAIRAGAEGIGFAIPVDRAWKVAQDMLTFGEVRAPWLGVDLKDISRQRLQGTPVAAGAVQVVRVYPESPAAKAGLKAGDLLYQSQGRPVRSTADLNGALAEEKPGAKLTLQLYRGATAMKVDLTTISLPEGVEATVLKDTLGAQLQVVNGALVFSSLTATGSCVKRGIVVGDVLHAVDGRPVKSLDELNLALRRAKAHHRASVVFTVSRGRMRGNLTVDI